MKKLVLLFFIAAPFLFTMCKKSSDENYNTEAVACGIKNPIKNIAWLNEKYIYLEKSIGSGIGSIVLYNYQNTEIIEVTISYSSGLPERYACNGEQFAAYSPAEHNDYMANRLKVAVLYGSW